MRTWLLAFSTVAACQSYGLMEALPPEENTIDAGAIDTTTDDASVGTPTPNTVMDAGRDAESGGPAPTCNPSGGFTSFAPVVQGGQQLAVRQLRMTRDGRRIYYTEGNANTLRVADLAAAQISNSKDIGSLGVSGDGGFFVSDSELELLVSVASGPSFVKVVRASTSVPFSAGGTPIRPRGTLGAGDRLGAPYLASPNGTTNDTLMVAVLRSPDQRWSIMRGNLTANDLVIRDTETLTGFDHASAPVLADPLHVVYAGWNGLFTSPRLVQAERATPTSAWNRPQAVTIGGFNASGAQAVVPFAVSSNGCSMLFGVSSSSAQTTYLIHRAERTPL